MKSKKQIVIVAVVALVTISPLLARNLTTSENEMNLSSTNNYPTQTIGINDPDTVNYGYTEAYVDFNYFEEVSAQAKEHRKSRLIDFATFNQFARDENTIILDSRSKRMYDRMHIAGAMHINFADFTQQYLAEKIPDKNTRILIYCNNNFKQEPIFEIPFATKSVQPIQLDVSALNGKQPLVEKTLALNIPTYINLFGYGYKNVYELHELVSSQHPGLQLEGTDVLNLKAAE
ncbi:rhodanese-like domain-containing protein [Paracrocinitomix mangrovi]|uniref:rhodanese-like domain-containing protein n=1 Tax=Paracrocinitomix mangrovi TaxID=2862509 RepID=UPI001C8E79A3|nr:rhodanese-like domain-containing protein [Paracrocinitomix mangrovi]UKN00260.1 rhodanese-like domain-containing protein [Paracrocinitomix mangrovi]